jgi:hypothetical protein
MDSPTSKPVFIFTTTCGRVGSERSIPPHRTGFGHVGVTQPGHAPAIHYSAFSCLPRRIAKGRERDAARVVAGARLDQRVLERAHIRHVGTRAVRREHKGKGITPYPTEAMGFIAPGSTTTSR